MNILNKKYMYIYVFFDTEVYVYIDTLHITNRTLEPPCAAKAVNSENPPGQNYMVVIERSSNLRNFFWTVVSCHKLRCRIHICVKSSSKITFWNFLDLLTIFVSPFVTYNKQPCYICHISPRSTSFKAVFRMKVEGTIPLDKWEFF